MLPEPSVLVTAAFAALPLLVAAGFVGACEWAGRRLGESAELRRRRVLLAGAGALIWLSATALLAASGILRRFDVLPPPFGLLGIAAAALGIAVSVSPLGRLLAHGLPLWALVGFQAFRLPLELVMHQAYVEGVMPVQMSYSGRNYDIVTGTTAAVLGLWLYWRPAPRWLVSIWNLLGFSLLVNIVAVAVLSTPLFAAFGNEQLNTFVTYAPFVWLPAVLVVAALMGHILVWRQLAR